MTRSGRSAGRRGWRACRSARSRVSGDVNANLVFTWLRDARFASVGTVDDEPAVEPSGFLPVQIVDRWQSEGPASTLDPGTIEIDVAGGHRLRIVGAYDPEALARLIRGLSP